MARVLDITDRLTFDGNPSLKIRDKVLEVNADAPTMLKVMSFMQDGGVGNEQVVEAYNLVFPEKSQKAIEEMKLSINDWMIVVQAAMELITGPASETQGEA
ncbi:hypothetical protein [Brotaphodocola sp.]|uniref:hypothetical protein n=1 Tax=Brotaphodocola sp. TaxID=3073577 RepID=UPI003D7CEE41